MPGDSIIYITPKGDTLFLPDSLTHYSEIRVVHNVEPEASYGDGFEWVLGFFIVIFIFRLFFPLIMQNYRRKQRLRKTLLAIHEHGEQYNEWLQHYNGFYLKLQPSGKKRFLQRAVEFMRSKEFVYHDGMEKDEKVELLVSSAAIQITFGLQQYLLDYFKTIHILKNDYTYGLYSMPFMGHVNSEGIYLSWNNFLSGYENYNDANNVGLHEMAHALTYENFTSGSNSADIEFKRRFVKFSQVARPIFNNMKAGESTFLDNYAATNYQEFWAVSIENFFEKPSQFKAAMPDLYDALCYLLNQDPLSEQVIVTV